MLNIGMNRGIYSSAKAMQTTTQWMDVISNNLANASTDGYKTDTIAFADVLVKNMYANGGSGKFLGSVGSGPDAVVESTDMKLGPVRSTGNPLDIALQDPKQMLAVSVDGRTQYTRDGALKVDSDKFLVTQRGHRVLDDRGQPIKLGNEGLVHISPTGQVMQGTDEIASLGIFTGVFTKEGNNLWSAPQPNRVTEPTLAIASLEGSNVDAVATMVDLIKITRHFEMSQKSIQSQDDMTGKLFEILKR